jgi:soluble lytic murein transglycosylase-like protein
MRLSTSKLCIACLSLGLACLPAKAQFRTTLNDRGNLVFVNDDAPAPTAEPAKNRVAAASNQPKSDTADSTAQPAATPNRRPTTPQELDKMVEDTAQKHRVDPRLVRAVISTESNWNAGAISRTGAQGLMQLIPGTAQQMGVTDAFDPEQNVDGGVRYLGLMLTRYNGDVHKALAAYNAGPGAVDRWGGIPRISETQNYVQKVTSAYMGGTGLRPQTVAAPVPIYRSVEADGRVVFRNE